MNYLWCTNYSSVRTNTRFTVVQNELSFKKSYLELWRPSSSAKLHHLCNFGRGLYGEHSCEIILNLDKWFRRCRLKKKFTDDAQRPITIAHLDPSAQVS